MVQFQEGRWKGYYNYYYYYCYYYYREHNCFSYFLCKQFINRGHLAVVAISDCQEVIVPRKLLFVYWMGRKKLKQFSFTYLNSIHSLPLM